LGCGATTMAYIHGRYPFHRCSKCGKRRITFGGGLCWQCSEFHGKCEACGNGFIQTDKQHIYCSHSCRIHTLANRHYAKRKNAINEKGRAKYHIHIEKQRARGRARQRKLKEEMIAAYGGKCACCGESEYRFMSLDHIYMDGKQHRALVGSGSATWMALKHQGWPQDRYRLLCMNCNFAARFGVVCPHETNQTYGVSEC